MSDFLFLNFIFLSFFFVGLNVCSAIIIFLFLTIFFFLLRLVVRVKFEQHFAISLVSFSKSIQNLFFQFVSNLGQMLINYSQIVEIHGFGGIFELFHRKVSVFRNSCEINGVNKSYRLVVVFLINLEYPLNNSDGSFFKLGVWFFVHQS